MNGTGEARQELSKAVPAFDMREFVEKDQPASFGGPVAGVQRDKKNRVEEAPGHGHNGAMTLQEPHGAGEGNPTLHR